MSSTVASPSFRLIVGLGNPGREYRATRHNVGFMILDRISASAGAAWRTEKAWQAELARAGEVFLCKPQTYMNLSGESVGAIAGFYKIPTEQVLIVLDDMALPLGKLRLRANGSAGGHNGLQSVIEHLGTQQVARLRVGIGTAKPGEAVGHVLGRFALEETSALEQSLSRAVEAIDCAQTRGLEAAMNAFNQPTKPTTDSA
jgi:PTH1 family peptidyl-tRNA hydrolase